MTKNGSAGFQDELISTRNANVRTAQSWGGVSTYHTAEASAEDLGWRPLFRRTTCRCHFTSTAALFTLMVASIVVQPTLADDNSINTYSPFGTTSTSGQSLMLISKVDIGPSSPQAADPPETSHPGKAGGAKVAIVVTIKEGTGFLRYDRIYPFFGVMDGSDPKFQDTDSAQCAVRFTDDHGNDVGHDTNARNAATARGCTPNCAAKWTRVTGKGAAPNLEVRWQTAVPKAATHVEILLIYTDGLVNTPADHADTRSDPKTPNSNTNGDIPLVIGSWSGVLKNPGRPGSTWTITKNAADLWKQTRRYPKQSEITNTVASVKRLFLGKTGYAVLERPAVLAGNSDPMVVDPDDPTKMIVSPEKAAAIQKLIDDAGAAGRINNGPPDKPGYHDTGFDIVPR